MQNNLATRESILRQMQDAEESAARLFEGVSAIQGNWRPQDGSAWSIWQCVEHLSLTNQIYAKALNEGLANADATHKKATDTEIKPGWFGRFFISKVEPPVGVGVKTKPSATPPAKGDLGQALVLFRESHEGLREIVKFWDNLDLNRVRYPNPFLPLVRFSVGTGLLIANAHDRRHLWQAQQVKLTAGYPKE